MTRSSYGNVLAVKQRLTTWAENANWKGSTATNAFDENANFNLEYNYRALIRRLDAIIQEEMPSSAFVVGPVYTKA